MRFCRQGVVVAVIACQTADSLSRWRPPCDIEDPMIMGFGVMGERAWNWRIGGLRYWI